MHSIKFIAYLWIRCCFFEFQA